MKRLKSLIRKYGLNIVGVLFSAILLVFAIWQLDIICVGRVWGSVEENIEFYTWLKEQNYHSLSEYPFQCFLWVTTIGRAYDTLLFLIFTAYVLLFVSLITWKVEERKEKTK